MNNFESKTKCNLVLSKNNETITFSNLKLINYFYAFIIIVDINRLSKNCEKSCY